VLAIAATPAPTATPPQTALRPACQQPLSPLPWHPSQAGQQARSRLPSRRQSHSTNRRSPYRL